MNKSKNPKRPNPFLYHLAVPLAKIYAKLVVGLVVDKSAIKGMKPPFVVLSNHISNMDFLLSSTAMHPYRMNYVAGAYLFSKPLSRWAYGQMGAISKQQFMPDLPAIRKMKYVTDHGGVLIIFPSGQSSFTGACTIIPPGIEKLLKMLNVPVVNMHIAGAHMSYPKWDRTKIRKTRIDVTVTPLFSQNQLEMMSPAEVYEAVNQALAFDDYEWQRGARLSTRKPRSAVGLQKILYVCPKCGREFTMETQGSRLFCTACGNAALMDEYGLLLPEITDSAIFDTPVKWYRWQMEQLGKQLDEPAYALESTVVLSEVLPNTRHVPLGTGRITLSMSGLQYDKAEGGGPDSLHVDSAMVPVFAHESEVSFDTAINGKLYNFAPENPKAAFKFVALEELIFIRLNKR